MKKYKQKELHSTGTVPSKTGARDSTGSTKVILVKSFEENKQEQEKKF
jgi:hypothetical protein